MHVIADIVESNYEILRGIFYQVNPQTLIVKAKLEPERLAVIHLLVGIESIEVNVQQDNDASKSENNESYQEAPVSDKGGSKGQRTCCRLQQVPSSFFNLESVRNK